MKDYRNFILINTDNFLVTATFANCSSDVSYKKYQRTHPVKNHINNNIDTLRILNKHLAQIANWKEEDRALSMYYILVPPKFCKIIKDKIYREWLTTKKNSAGLSISNEELEQWKMFEVLYKLVYVDIIFKPTNLYNAKDANKAYKHVVFTKNVIDKVYDYLNKLEDNIKVKRIDNLSSK